MMKRSTKSFFGARVMETVARLRQVQEELADESAEVRQRRMCEEVERHLAHVAEDQRKRFLDEVLQRVPWSDEGADGAQKAEEKAERSGRSGVTRVPRSPQPPDESHTADMTKTFDALVDELIEAWPALDAPAKKRTAARLAAHGIADPATKASGSPPLDDPIERLRGKLRLKRTVALNADQVVWLANELLPFVMQSSDVSLRVWGKLSAGLSTTSSGPPAMPQKILQQYFTGDQNVTREQAEACLEHHRQLIISLLQTLDVVGRIVSQTIEPLSTENVERMAKLEQKSEGLFKKRKPAADACWETFKSISRQHEPARIEQDVKCQLAEYVEQFLRHR